jgi:hypothetical protein
MSFRDLPENRLLSLQDSVTGLVSVVERETDAGFWSDSDLMVSDRPSFGRPQRKADRTLRLSKPPQTRLSTVSLVFSF